MQWGLSGSRRLLRRWQHVLRTRLSDARTITRLSVLVGVPFVVAIVTWLSNVSDLVAFLLFPPLAAGTYSLIVDPQGASVRMFVAGITAGALSGWAAVLVVGAVPTVLGAGPVSPAGAAVSVLFAGLVSLLVGLEEPAAFSTALLVLVTGTSEAVYVGGMVASTLLVAGAFLLYRDRIYTPGIEYLYHTLEEVHSVVVPLAGPEGRSRGHFAGQLAADDSGGRVVLVTAAAETTPTDTATTVEELATEIETAYGVSTEIVVTDREPTAPEAATIARETASDLILAPFDPTQPQELVPFLRTGVDVVGLKTTPGRTLWERILIGVSGREQTDRSLVDLADRIGTELSLYHYSKTGESDAQRDRLLASLVRMTTAVVDTRIGTTPPEQFFPRATDGYELLVVGASMDRAAVSRAVLPPQFYTVEADCDIAVVNRSVEGP